MAPCKKELTPPGGRPDQIERDHIMEIEERMNSSEKDFFCEATLRICGGLDIEKALQSCLLYIREFIPTNQMGFHVYHRALGIVETIAIATPNECLTMSISTHLPAGARKQIEKQRSIRVRKVERMGDDEVTRPVVAEMGEGWQDALEMPCLVMDLVIEGTLLGVLSIYGNGQKGFNWRHMRLISLLNKPFAVALTNSLRYRELSRFKDRLEDDNRYLQDELRRMAGEEIVGAEYGLKGVMDLVRQVAPIQSPVLLLGETGTGKEVIANAVHNLSPRRSGPFIRFNCGAIPHSLMDSELFGHEKGAFTGAVARKRGRFERAQGGTIFLDEIGELPADAQVRLLRVLQDREIERVGGTEPIKLDIRVIAATHRNLETMLAQGNFREDLYFRLKVFPILLPPLRNRRDDIPGLVQHFIQKKARDMKLTVIPELSPGALERLMDYAWPGNVRELENAVERALILSRGNPVAFGDIGNRVAPETPRSENMPLSHPSPGELELDKVTARHIHRVLTMCRGRVEGYGGAAELLKINPSTLRKRMKKLGIPFGRKGIRYDT